MRLCLSCQQPIPTLQDLRRERRWYSLSIIVALMWAMIFGGSIGYLLRDSVFLKRENVTLSSLLNAYVKRVETDKLVTENQALRAKGRH